MAKKVSSLGHRHDANDLTPFLTASATISGDWTISGAWTFDGVPTFTNDASGTTNSIVLAADLPSIWFNDTGGTTDESDYKFYAGDDNFYFYGTTDAGSSQLKIWQVINRSGVSSAEFQVTQPMSISIGNGEALTLKAGSTGSPANSWIQFDDSAASRMGFLGYGSSQNPDLYIWNDIGDVRIQASTSGNVYTESGAEFRVYDSGDTDYISLVHTGTVGKVEINSGPIQFADDINIVAVNDLRLASSAGTVQTTSGRMKAELLTIADDATDVFLSANNSTYRLYILVSSFNSTAAAMWFSTSQQTPQVVFQGSAVSINASTNPDVDGNVNIWQSSSTAVSIKNRLGSTRTFTLYSIGL